MSDHNTSARLIEVIETTTTRGKGVEGNPYRIVTTYWSKDGQKLAEVDPCSSTSTDPSAA